MRRLHLLPTLLCVAALLSGCGFHLRNASSIPPQLQTITLTTSNPYSQFSRKIRNQLLALDISLKPTPNPQTYTLNITNESMTHTTPSLSSSSTTATYTYTFKVSASLTQNDKSIIPTKTFSSSKSVTQQASNSTITTVPASITTELQENVLSQIFMWLTDGNTKDTLSKQQG